MNNNNNQMQNQRNEKKENQRREYGVDFYHPLWGFFNDALSDYENTNVLRTDVTEEDKDYKYEVEVPGIDKKDIKVSLDNGYLTINAHVERNGEEHGKRIRSERYTGSFTRSFYVGDNVQKKDLSAEVKNGVLTITIQKSPEAPASDKYIEIH